TPVFTAVVLVTLAMGIGANAAIFSVVNAVILRPIGYPNPKQLMLLKSQFPQMPSVRELTTPEYEVFRERNRSFAHVGAFMLREANLTAGDRPLRVRSAAVDEALVAALGIQPSQGRAFAPGETDARADGAPPLAIVSHELWQTAFGAQPLVGETVSID